MKKKPEMKMVCTECGKDAPVDNDKSNENWTVYKTVCDCGGRCELKFGG